MAQVSPIQRAKSILEEVKGQILFPQDLLRVSIELAEAMLEASFVAQTASQRKQQRELAQMIEDPLGKQFLVAVTDQSFRSRSSCRVANQINYLLQRNGIPKCLSRDKRLGLRLFQRFAPFVPFLCVPLLRKMLRKEATRVILPGERQALKAYIQKRSHQGIRINLNHLGEAILGEEEAQKRLETYLRDLRQPEIEYISVKISTLYSQINLLAWQETLEALKRRLRILFQEAQTQRYTRRDGTESPKFVNLDMEEYRDLRLTVALFKAVLDEPEFHTLPAGIVLQSYLPDSFAIQQELTEWAQERLSKGGAKIKIRIVKGANLAMERVEASLKNWPQAPFLNKEQSDANFKKMVRFGMEHGHTQAVTLGIASHNLLDIALALVMRSQKNLEQSVEFEMLEGMAEPMQEVVRKLAGQILLYCPVATQAEFQYAMAYLIRRLDENTASENFLHDLFDLTPDSLAWKRQVEFFQRSFKSLESVPDSPQRYQNRRLPPNKPDLHVPFVNEADTDWSLPDNRLWAQEIRTQFQHRDFDYIPLVIGGKTLPFVQARSEVGYDPSQPNRELYRYSLATEAEVAQALQSAKAVFPEWSELALPKRSALLAEVAQLLRQQRSTLMGIMLADGGKVISEADSEVSEAIDFLEYYRRHVEELAHIKDVDWKPKGTVLVASPWNFPCAIPVGGIAAALAAGNCVIFKPAPESVLVGWTLVQLFWEAGISKEVLQFVTCTDDPVGSALIRSPDLDCVILTGGTATAKHLLKLRPGLDLLAETGGKNAMIITSMADRDLAIKDLVQSAFGHAGQKCSACSLAILEAEVYDDPLFRKNLCDAVASLSVGSAWEAETVINPLIRPAGQTLLKGLTMLESGEEWLLEPRQDVENPNIWSPGIKLGVNYRSFTYSNELFGPVLGLMRAESLDEAIALANGTPYGLTAGLHTLDEREQEHWVKKMMAGNCYINRTMTGAIVQRQPFGGAKESCYGPGAKAGGPNYVMQLFHPEQLTLPHEQGAMPGNLAALAAYAEKHLNAEEFLEWESSVNNYAFYYEVYFSKPHDPSHILGQDNLFRYVPQEAITLFIQAEDTKLEVLQCLAAAKIAGTPLKLYGYKDEMRRFEGIPTVECVVGSIFALLQEGMPHRLRLLRELPAAGMHALADQGWHYRVSKPLANGRVELLKYLREVVVSNSYHRYGNLGLRDKAPYEAYALS